MTLPSLLGDYEQLNATDKLVVAVSQALAAFITYESRRHQRVNLFESFLYKPIIDISDARGWQVNHEYRIRSNVNSLMNKEIDFVLKKNSHVCSLEIKYYRSISSAKTSLSNIDSDIDKLNYFDKSRMRDVSAVGGYLLIVGKRGLLESAFSVRPRDKVRQSLYDKATFLLREGHNDKFYDCGWRSDEIGAGIVKNAVLTLRIKNQVYR